jgi:hypothetical protein
VKQDGVADSKPFHERFTEVTLTARVTIPDSGFDHLSALSIGTRSAANGGSSTGK